MTLFYYCLNVSFARNLYLLDLPLYRVLTDRSGLQSYIDNALTPLVRALKSEVGLGIWEIINEPEGSMHMGTHRDLILFTAQCNITANSSITHERISTKK